tara:strand:- start:24 stop:317 length:294 start_codon:yes stop_codon:yes gene_type:complete
MTQILNDEFQAIKNYINELVYENEKLACEKLQLQYEIIRLEDVISNHTTLKIENDFLILQNNHLQESIFHRYLLNYKYYVIDPLFWPLKKLFKMLEN